MSVESATAQMANTTLTEPPGTAQGASVGQGGEPINASQNEAVIQSAAEGRRLYIGNLAYATTEGELKEFFKDYLVYASIYTQPSLFTDMRRCSETTSIPTNPRTTRPVGYAFVDVSTPSEAERAINELNGKSILDRKVSVQLARKPEPAGEKTEAAGADGEGQKRRNSQRNRNGRGRARASRGGRAGRGVSARSYITLCIILTRDRRRRTARPRKVRLPTAPLVQPTSLAKLHRSLRPPTKLSLLLLARKGSMPRSLARRRPSSLASSAAHLRTAFQARTRSWSPTCLTTCGRRGYA